jgi:hypothetical protein
MSCAVAFSCGFDFDVMSSAAHGFFSEQFSHPSALQRLSLDVPRPLHGVQSDHAGQSLHVQTILDLHSSKPGVLH